MVFWKGVHFLNARVKVKVRILTFLRLYPTNFHKTKCIAYANKSAFHKMDQNEAKVSEMLFGNKKSNCKKVKIYPS